MKNITINYTKQTIQMTKAYADKAGKVGSREFEELTKIHSMYPQYQIVIVSSKSNSSAKGLDYDFIEKYISLQIDEKRREELTKDFEDLRAADLSYFEIRSWFVNEFPLFKDCKCRADVVLAMRKAQIAQKANSEEANIVEAA